MRIRPPFLAGLYLLAALGLNYLFPETTVIHSPYHFIGIVALGAGIVLAVGALRLFKKKGTPHNPFAMPTALVTTGPFRFSRSPMYLGVTCLLLGIALLVGTLPLFLAPVAFALTMNASYIPREERNLERQFGQEYMDYKNRVRRWL